MAHGVTVYVYFTCFIISLYIRTYDLTHSSHQWTYTKQRSAI